MTTSILNRELCLTLACDVHASGNGTGSVVSLAKQFEDYLTGVEVRGVEVGSLDVGGMAGEMIADQAAGPVSYLIAPVFAVGEYSPVNNAPFRFCGTEGNALSWAEFGVMMRGKPLKAWRIYRRDAPVEMAGGEYLDLGYGLLTEVPSRCLSFVDDGRVLDYTQRPKGIPGPAYVDAGNAA